MLKKGMFIRLVVGNSCHGVFVTSVMSASWRHKIVLCDGIRRAPFCRPVFQGSLALQAVRCLRVVFCCKDRDNSA